MVKLGTVIRAWIRSRRLWVAFVLVVIGLSPTTTALAQDGEVAAVAESLTYVWMILTGVLVFLMQAGFALLEAGVSRGRNVGSVFMKNLMDLLMCGLAYWAFGYALMYGGDGALVGSDGFFLAGDFATTEVARDWFFQMVFAATAATIVSGAMAERSRLDSYMAYSFLISAIVYPIYGHWVWGGGWLADLGAWDFAGSGVVHAVGGVAAFVGAKMVGPRSGKFDEQGRPRAIPGHNMAFVVLGTLVLFFGWFGFNSGSTLDGNDLQISVIVVNTFLAGVAGGIVAYYIRLARTGKADVAVTCSGIIAGLVGITAPCAFVDSWAAVVIGGIAGWLVIFGAGLIERRLRVDDPVWAIACHGVCGLWGLVAVGIFANGKYVGEVSGLINGRTDLIVAQIVSIIVLVAWAGVTSAIIFGFIRSSIGLRVSPQDEEAGLDASEFTQPGYVPSDV